MLRFIILFLTLSNVFSNENCNPYAFQFAIDSCEPIQLKKIRFEKFGQCFDDANKFYDDIHKELKISEHSDEIFKQFQNNLPENFFEDFLKNGESLDDLIKNYLGLHKTIKGKGLYQQNQPFLSKQQLLTIKDFCKFLSGESTFSCKKYNLLNDYDKVLLYDYQRTKGVINGLSGSADDGCFFEFIFKVRTLGYQHCGKILSFIINEKKETKKKPVSVIESKISETYLEKISSILALNSSEKSPLANMEKLNENKEFTSIRRQANKNIDQKELKENIESFFGEDISDEQIKSLHEPNLEKINEFTLQCKKLSIVTKRGKCFQYFKSLYTTKDDKELFQEKMIFLKQSSHQGLRNLVPNNCLEKNLKAEVLCEFIKKFLKDKGSTERITETVKFNEKELYRNLIVLEQLVELYDKSQILTMKNNQDLIDLLKTIDSELIELIAAKYFSKLENSDSKIKETYHKLEDSKKKQ